MSYILEALKKAQAERQLGSAPSIHSPTLQVAPVAAPRPRGWGVWAGLAAAGLGVAIALWSSRGQEPAVVQAPAVVRAPVVAAPVAAPPVAVAAPPAAPLPAVPPPVPAVVEPAAPAAVARAPKVPKKPAAGRAATPVAANPVVAAAPAPANDEEPVPNLRSLPESVQRTVPQVVFGGYMYSDNPADRLLLIDKVLRHEGEEVAPGLVLEKLLPKAAVMNYRGLRYRVPY